MSETLTPTQTVAALDRYIVGQRRAKRAVAIAMRNRYRRRHVPLDLRDEVVPKNILMIGPTGVGKTEIARRLASLVGAPFVKVEATKYTEVGYVGRDVESMVRDLVEAAIRLVREERQQDVREAAEAAAVERVIDVLYPETRPSRPSAPNPLASLTQFFGAMPGVTPQHPTTPTEPVAGSEELRARAREEVRRGFYDVRLVDIEIEESGTLPIGIIGGEIPGGPPTMPGGADLNEMLGGLLPKRRSSRRVSVAEAYRIFVEEESQRLIDADAVKREALRRASEDGIIFIDEFDKIAGREGNHGLDISREGVQRDILPIVEGSTVPTKHGSIKTDHILFIAAGAFHMSKPADLIPELQGRFPIRVELEPLTVEDLRTILTEPRNALTKQYAALLAVEGVRIEFRDDGIEAIARTAMQLNEGSESIGARRLHTVLERLLEDISFAAPEHVEEVVIDAAFVERQLADVKRESELGAFIL